MWLNGAGEASNEPEGLLTGGTAYTTSGTVTFDRADLEGAQEAVAPRWQGNAVWCGNLHSRNEIDQFVAAADTSQAPIVDAQGRVLRRPFHEVSGLPSAAHTTTPLIYGDVRAGYRIVDRLGCRWSSCLTCSAPTADPRARGLYRLLARRRSA